MDTNQKAYDVWAEQYDTNKNRTRDLEKTALRTLMMPLQPLFNVLEIGCGTGKNTEWLLQYAHKVTAVDFSAEMLNKAKAKVKDPNVVFIQADIAKPWTFTDEFFDVIVFSLVLEHIENLDFIFQELAKRTRFGALTYIGELHPYKQYQGTLARFDAPEGRVELTCFKHHISDFVNAAKKYNYYLTDLNEWFDEDGESEVPRILTLILEKKGQA